MWKRGVTANDAFARYALEHERTRKGWWPFAYTLLEDLQAHFRPADEPLIERLYQSMAAGDGIFKITRRARFTALDEWLANEIKAIKPGTSPVVVHDVGASSGVTTLELWSRLKRDSTVVVHASDYFDTLDLVTVPGTRWTVAFATDGRPLQFSNDWYVLPVSRKESWRYPWNRWLQSRANATILPEAKRLRDAGQGNPTGSIRRVSLFHPEATATAATSKTFKLLRHDVFQPNPIACDVLRAMNILTPNHFPADKVREAIAACLHNLRDGGLFLIGRNVDEEDGRLRATACRWQSGVLTPIFETHAGYEWPELLDKHRGIGFQPVIKNTVG